MKPFLKWAGSKSWLPDRIDFPVIPTSARWVEPFAGAGAMALHYLPDRVLLGDANPELICCWQWAQAGAGAPHLVLPHTAEQYLNLRSSFNDARKKEIWRSPEWLGKAFYLLNRYSFNGVWRENGSREFNVPFAADKTGKPLPSYDWQALQQAIAHWQFSSGDFEAIDLHPDDVVYADPPYDTEFHSYQAGGFSWQDQERLAVWLARHPGVVIASNEPTPRILELYRSHGFDVHLIPGRRNAISCKASSREVVPEMLAVRNFSELKIKQIWEETA